MLVIMCGCATAGTSTTTISKAQDGTFTIREQDSDLDQALKATQAAANVAQAAASAGQAGMLIKSLADSL